jgi:MFS family permease
MSKMNRTKNWSARALPYIIFFLASSFYIYEFLMRVMPSTMAHPLMQSFNIGAQGYGILASLFYWGYTPMQIPAGLIYDRFGPRKLLSISIFLCAISGLILGHAHSVYLAGAGRFLTGFTASFAFIGALLIAAHWFKPQRFAMFTGLVQLLGCLGAIIGEAPIAALVKAIGWRPTINVLSTIGIFTSLAIWLIIRDYPKNKPKIPAPLIKNTKTLTGLKRICRNPQTWWVGLYGFCCWAPITIFATLWGPSFLAMLYHTSKTDAAAMTSIVWVAIAIGSPIAGWWSNRIGQRRLPLALCSTIGLLSSTMLLFGGPLPHIEMAVLLFLFGLSASSQVITFALVLDNNHDRVMGTAVGFNNMAVIAGGLILQPLVGIVLKHVWNHHPYQIHHIPIYSVTDYHAALISIPCCFVVGLLCALFAIKETHCKRLAQQNQPQGLHNLAHS